MRLKLLLPTTILVDEPAQRISGEGVEGSFTLLPRHIDYVTVLPPSLLSFINARDEEKFVALDEGILVKRGDVVLVSVRNAVHGDGLGHLHRVLDQQFREQGELEQRARSAALRLESDLVRQFIELR
jgi:F-type H+-transporting ATPase subunit epsilon